jgi:hypothetical protein
MDECKIAGSKSSDLKSKGAELLSTILARFSALNDLMISNLLSCIRPLSHFSICGTAFYNLNNYFHHLNAGLVGVRLL